ncbi:MAG: BatA domain-containing protein [Bacteroidales bacterium]|nr:BatA domain-containing protein [Bacteroidales bacterium]
MSFLYPSLLWALFALLIPILVHLFNFRKHKLVYFSNTAVLKNIQQETVRTKKLKQLVLLLLRCLFIAALVLAFAYPYKPADTAKINTDEGVVGVFIDNSMSMKALSDKTTLIEDAREQAKELVNGFPPSTRYLLLTNSFEVQNEYPMSQQEMLDNLDRMRLEGPPVKLCEVIDRFAMLRKMHGFDHASLVVYSDFQQNMFDLGNVAPDTTLLVVAVPMRASSTVNLSVDTLWLASPVVQPGMANELHAVVANHGEREVKGLPVNLAMDGKTVASTTVDVEGGGTAELTVQVVPERSGDIPCTLSLMDYPITFDDTYRFVIGVKSRMNVVELNSSRQPSPIALIFDADPQFDYTWMAPNGCDFDALSKAQLIVVNQASEVNATVQQSLLKAAMEGASVAFFHDDGAAIDTNTLAVSDVARQYEFFSDIIIDLPQHADLPQVKRHVRLNLTPDKHALMHLANGDALLTELTVGKGHFYDFATTLDPQWSNFADHAIIVPLMLKMALVGGGVGRLSYTVGETASFQEEITEAGFYEQTTADSVVKVQAWNDSRLESDMRFVDDETIASQFKAAGLEMSGETEAQKSSLWRWLVLLALLAVIAEISVLRFWK